VLKRWRWAQRSRRRRDHEESRLKKGLRVDWRVGGRFLTLGNDVYATHEKTTFSDVYIDWRERERRERSGARVCSANFGKETGKRNERRKSVREKVNMYSGADVEITAEAAWGGRLRTILCIYSYNSVSCLRRRFSLQTRLLLQRALYLYVKIGTRIFQFACRRVLYSTFDVVKYNF